MTTVEKILARYRYSLILLRELVVTDFKLRYQSSFLGYLWSLLKPLAIFAILYFVFTKAFPVRGTIPHYDVILLSGVVIWYYFSEVTNMGVSAIVGKGDMLRKINFPKYVIVLAGSLSAFINLCINFLVVAVLMVLTDVDISRSIILMPLVILELFALSLAMAFLLSALFVKLRDINYIWEVVMQGAFYATPVIFDISFFANLGYVELQKILILNPVAQIIQDFRHVVITPESPTIGTIYGNEWMRAVPVGVVIILSIVAVWYFRKRSPYFAEEI